MGGSIGVECKFRESCLLFAFLFLLFVPTLFILSILFRYLRYIRVELA